VRVPPSRRCFAPVAELTHTSEEVTLPRPGQRLRDRMLVAALHGYGRRIDGGPSWHGSDALWCGGVVVGWLRMSILENCTACQKPVMADREIGHPVWLDGRYVLKAQTSFIMSVRMPLGVCEADTLN